MIEELHVERFLGRVPHGAFIIHRVTHGYAILALVSSMALTGSSARAERASAPPDSRLASVAWTDGGAGVPSGYHVESRPRWGLVFWGSGAFVVSYVGAVAGATSNDAGGWLYLPVAGPFVNVAVRDTCKGEACTTADLVQRIFLVIDGVAQLAGATMVIGGFAWPERALVPDRTQVNGSQSGESQVDVRPPRTPWHRARGERHVLIGLMATAARWGS